MIARLLHEAKNAAGAQAVVANRRSDYVRASEWSALAIRIDELMRDAIEITARSVSLTPMGGLLSELTKETRP
jgi:hypothetical protein